MGWIVRKRGKKARIAEFDICKIEFRHRQSLYSYACELKVFAQVYSNTQEENAKGGIS